MYVYKIILYARTRGAGGGLVLCEYGGCSRRENTACACKIRLVKERAFISFVYGTYYT